MGRCKYGEALAALPTEHRNVLEGLTSRPASQMLGIGKSSVNDHRKNICSCSTPDKTPKPETVAGESETHDADGTSHYTRFSDKPWGFDQYREFIRSTGQDPDKVTFTWGWTSNPGGGCWNKLNNVRPVTAGSDGGPAWPVIQPAARVVFNLPASNPAPPRGMKLALKCADTQIGYRRLPDGSLEPFHDAAAMAVFASVCLYYQPDKIVILGDFLDLAAQGRWTQEAGFAQTTQPALDTGHKFLVALRTACPNAEIIIVEGNHDKRMQSFIEANALAAFGLRRANMPDSWPNMSMPFLLRLDELNIQYVDAYPAATDWDNDLTRNIHGTKSNSKGSTTAQYVTDLPHLNTWAGHTHRTEITYRSVLGPRGASVESYSANPGCLCRTDGAVPGTNSAITAEGASARIVENWQQGFGMAYYNDTESWPYVYRIRDGRAIVEGREFRQVA